MHYNYIPLISFTINSYLNVQNLELLKRVNLSMKNCHGRIKRMVVSFKCYIFVIHVASVQFQTKKELLCLVVLNKTVNNLVSTVLIITLKALGNWCKSCWQNCTSLHHLQLHNARELK